MVTAELGATTPVGIDIAPRYYWPSPGGVQVIGDDAVHGFRLGRPKDWAILPKEDSQLDVLLCDHSPRSSVGLDDDSINIAFTSASFTARFHEASLGPIGEPSCPATA